MLFFKINVCGNMVVCLYGVKIDFNDEIDFMDVIYKVVIS